MYETTTRKRTDAERAREAAEVVASARSKVAALARTYSLAKDDVASRPESDYNPRGHLSSAGVREAKNKDLETVADAYRAGLDELLEEVRANAARLETFAASEPLPDASAMARRTAHWRRAEALLDAGQVPAQVIKAQTDPEALQAIRDELPTHITVGLQRNGRTIGNSADADLYASMIDTRLAELDGDAAAYATARDAMGKVPATEALIDEAHGLPMAVLPRSLSRSRPAERPQHNPAYVVDFPSGTT